MRIIIDITPKRHHEHQEPYSNWSGEWKLPLKTLIKIAFDTFMNMAVGSKVVHDEKYFKIKITTDE